MKVMVFTPTWETGDGQTAMRPETRAAVEAQDYDSEWSWEIGLHNPYPGQSHRNVLAQYERGRDTFLASDADALLVFEHDMTMPPDALWKLTAAAHNGVDVVYGVYLLRHGSWVLNAFEFTGGRNVGESLTIHPEKLVRARAEVTTRVSGAGFGCTLMRREVVEQFPFHKGDDDQWAPDMPFAVDCLRANVVSVARMDVECGHYDGGRWLWPFGRGGDNVRVIVLQTVNVYDGERVRRLTAGEEQELPADRVEDWIRAGFVATIDEPETTALAGPPERAVRKRPTKRKGGL